MEKCLNDELIQSKRLFEGIAHSIENNPNYKKLIEITSLMNLTNENMLSMMKTSKIKTDVKENLWMRRNQSTSIY